MRTHTTYAGAVFSGIRPYDGQALTDRCCVPGQAPQHKATSGGANPSVCRICVGFHSSTLALEFNMPDTSYQKNRKPAAAGT